jgi:hypothetical protein
MTVKLRATGNKCCIHFQVLYSACQRQHRNFINKEENYGQLKVVGLNNEHLSIMDSVVVKQQKYLQIPSDIMIETISHTVDKNSNKTRVSRTL